MAYRRIVMDECLTIKNKFSADKRIRMEVIAYPPDKRRRDLDNLGKSLLDSLQHAGLYQDDSQIDYLSFERMPEFLGKVVVYIYPSWRKTSAYRPGM